jgi:hypothetical protein
MAMLLVVMGFPVAASAAPDPEALTPLPVGFESYPNGALQTALSSNPAVLVPDTEYEVVLQWNLQEIQSGGGNFPSHLDFGLDLGDNIDIDFSSFPTSLLAVSDIQDLGNGTVRVSFHPDAAARMGSTPIETLSLKFQLTTQEEGVEASHINWRGKGGESQILLVPGDATLITGSNSLQKTPGAPTLTGVNAGRTSATFNDATLNVTVPYTVTTSTTAGGEMVITDAFRAPENAWLEYPAVSGFTVELTTWTDLGEGYGKQSTRTLSASEVADAIVVAADGKSFTFTEEVPANSTVKISYTASLTDEPSGIQAFKDDYVTRYNAADEGAMVYVPVRNDAERTVGASTLTTNTTAQVGIRKYQPNRPGIGTGDFSKDVNITALGFQDFDGLMNARTMENPVELTYTIHARLGKFDPTSSSVGEDENGDRDERFFTLTEDVLIKDTAPPGGEWVKAAGTPAGDPGPLDISSSPALTYKAATGTLNTDALLRAFLAPGEYTVIGKQLVANIGQNNASNWEITPKILVDAAGMTPNINSTTGYGYYTYRNTAYMAWVTQGGGSSFNDSADTTFTDRRDDDEREVTDPSVFDKTVGSSLVSTTPGQPAEVDYQITVRGGTANDDQIDLSQTDVVDHVDRNIFDLGDYNTGTKQFNNVELTARYTVGSTIRNYTATDFELAWDDTEGGLRITPTAATTADIEGRQILRITNSASYLGESSIEGNYRTSITSAGSSLGSAMTLVKAAYDEENDKFSTGVRILPGSLDSATDTAEAVFRLSMLVPGNFNGRINLNDNLTNAGLVFQGFVDGPQDTSPSTSQISLGRNIVVRASGNVIEITTNGSSTTTQPDASVYEVFYRVTIPDWSEREDEPIINVAGTSSAVVTITDKYPLNITKVDSTALSKEITDPNARFTVLDEDDNVVVSGASVQNNKLVIRDGDEVKAVLVDTPGTYTVREDRAPDGYLRTADTIEVTVNNDGTSSEVLFENAPAVTGEVALTKSVSGVLPASVGTAHDFVFDWAATPPSGVVLNDGDEEGEVTVKGGETVNLGIDFPEGTVVTFTERATSQPIAGHLFSGVTPTTLTATVGENNTQTVVATNTYAPMVSVGDYVWVDADRDGLQNEPDNAGINGVKLTLTDKDGNPVTDVHGNVVGPVVTSDDTSSNPGWYEFKDLPALTAGEEYVVTIDRDDDDTKDALAPYVPTLRGVGSDRSIDSSTWTATATHVGLTNGGDHNPTLDFGFVTPSFAIGDIVWIDLDRSGAQDNGEQPLAGVTVTLLDENGDPVTQDIAGDPIAPQITGADGLYLFDNLPEGTYRVRFELTADQGKQYQFTDYRHEDADADEDSDANVTSNPLVGETGDIVLNRANTALDPDYGDQPFIATQGVDPTWDAGVFPKSVSVGDLVWVDFNRDGIQDDDEQGIPGVELILTDKNGDPVRDIFDDPVDPTRTDPDGKYSFNNLPALKEGEQYIVTINYQHDRDTQDALAPYVPTREGANGGSGEFDSSTWTAIATHDGHNGLTENGDRNPTLDFGFILKSYAIGDKVWIDTDRNGDQSTDEAPLAGTKVELLVEDGSGNFVPAKDTQNRDVPATTTDEEGRYLFDNLPAGTYKVQFTLTERQAEIYDFTDSLKSGVDTGLNSDAEPTATKHIGLSGEIVLDENNADLTTSYDRGITATEGIDPTWDAGVVLKRVSIGDLVWVDENRDGQQDTGEPGIEGVKLVVTLVDEDGKPVLDDDGKPVVVKDVYGNAVAPQVTDTDGKYLFENLPALSTGTRYKVTIDTADAGTKKALEPYVPTIPGAGNDEGNDSSTSSEVAPWRGLQEDGAENLTLDFGFVTPSFAIGDIVWIDADRDGVQGSDEKPLAGVTVTLLDAATGEPVTKDIAGKDIKPIVTGKDGRYLFDNLPAGKYKVQFELTEEQGKTYKFTSNVPGANSTDNSDGVVTSNPLIAVTGEIVLDRTNAALDTEYDADFIATQGVDPTWDAGVVFKSVSVGDYVWFDKNGNGKQDKNEKGIGDVKLVLTDKNGKPVKDVFGNEVSAVWTDKDGKYTFENLPPLEPGQEYHVKIDRKDAKTKKALETYLPTLEGQGDAAFDSSTWVAIATSEGLTEDGDRNDTLDFGFILNPAWSGTGDQNLEGGDDDPAASETTDDADTEDRELLEETGFSGAPVVVLSAVLLALGGAFLAIRRRKV